MVSVPGECAKQCAICGKTERIKHKYKKDPDTGDYICAVCGVNKESECSEDQKIFIVFGVVIGICVLLMLIGWMWEHPILAIALIALIILCGITAMLLRHLRLVRQQDIDILNADVSKIGDDEATRRAEKYQDK
jgi:Flp pilus assembly protein TadB